MGKDDQTDPPIIREPGQGASGEAQKAVRDATIDLGVLGRFAMRRNLRFWAWWALRWQRDCKEANFADFFDSNSGMFGDKLKMHVPAAVRWRLERLTTEYGEPFLVLRGVFSRRFPQASLAAGLDADRKPGPAARRLLYRRRYDLIASALVAATGTTLTNRLRRHPVVTNYVSNPAAEQTRFTDGSDMPMRYRTETAENSPTQAGSGEGARIVLLACIENATAVPVYLIRADDVVANLSPEQCALLREMCFTGFVGWHDGILVPTQINQEKSILSGSDWLAFDPNRLDINAHALSENHRGAVCALMKSIRDVGAVQARRIVLRRGDALVVDNYRALMCRRAPKSEVIGLNPWAFGRPLLRWLRLYHGYKHPKV